MCTRTVLIGPVAAVRGLHTEECTLFPRVPATDKHRYYTQKDKTNKRQCKNSFVLKVTSKRTASAVYLFECRFLIWATWFLST